MASFIHGTDRLEIKTPADYPQKKTTKIVQALDRSASGIVHVESFDVRIASIFFIYSELPKAEATALLDWFINTTNGQEKTFSLVDDTNEYYDEVRFMTPDLQIVNTSFDLYAVKFPIEVVKK